VILGILLILFIYLDSQQNQLNFGIIASRGASNLVIRNHLKSFHIQMESYILSFFLSNLLFWSYIKSSLLLMDLAFVLDSMAIKELYFTLILSPCSLGDSDSP
jgi:hypothetical protein